MGANRLQLNAAKTDILRCSSQRRVDQLPSHHFSSVGPSSVVRNLGVRIDVGLTMSTHITKVVAGCFASLRQLRIVRRSLSHESFARLVVALILSRLDYCNRVLAGLPTSQLRRLQSVFHVTARLIHGVRRHDHVTPLLQQLHWLTMPGRVNLKLCVLVYRCLHGLGPEYFSEDFKLVSKIHSLQRLRSASSTDVVVPSTSSLVDHAFPVAGAREWNALPPKVTPRRPYLFISATSENFVFQRELRQ